MISEPVLEFDDGCLSLAAALYFSPCQELGLFDSRKCAQFCAWDSTWQVSRRGRKTDRVMLTNERSSHRF